MSSACLFLASFASFVIFVPSIINIIQIGYKEYFKRFRLLLTLYKKLGVSFFVKEIKYYTYQQLQSQIATECRYYFPIFLSYKNLIIVRKGNYGSFFVQKNTAFFGTGNHDKWEFKEVEFKLTYCLFGTILYNMLNNKIEKLSKNTIAILNMDELNSYSNNELTSIMRETKLKKLLK